MEKSKKIDICPLLLLIIIIAAGSLTMAIKVYNLI